MMFESLQHQVMSNIVEKTFDIDFQNPAVLPATSLRDFQSLMCRLIRSISVRIRMKNRVKLSL